MTVNMATVMVVAMGGSYCCCVGSVRRVTVTHRVESHRWVINVNGDPSLLSRRRRDHGERVAGCHRHGSAIELAEICPLL